MKQNEAKRGILFKHSKYRTMSNGRSARCFCELPGVLEAPHIARRFQKSSLALALSGNQRLINSIIALSFVLPGPASGH